MYVATHSAGGWTYLGEPVAAATPTAVVNPKLALGPNDLPSLAYTTWRPTEVSPTDYLVENFFRVLNR